MRKQAKKAAPPTPRTRTGWVDRRFFEDGHPISGLTLHGASRMVSGKPIDIPVKVTEVRPRK
jgi:hypothetical protein